MPEGQCCVTCQAEETSWYMRSAGTSPFTPSFLTRLAKAGPRLFTIRTHFSSSIASAVKYEVMMRFAFDYGLLLKGVFQKCPPIYMAVEFSEASSLTSPSCPQVYGSKSQKSRLMSIQQRTLVRNIRHGVMGMESKKPLPMLRIFSN